MKSAAFHTLGCKVNIYETEAMQQALIRAGYEIRTFEEPADVYVINTCSVTNIADRKSRQMLHRARTLNPGAVVVAAGCYAQAAGEKLKNDASVDIILGNHEKKEIAAVLERWFEENRPGNGAGQAAAEKSAVAAVGEIAAVKQYDDLSAGTMSDHTRAFLKIQDGCNQFCSYCIIPYVRGRIRSRRAEEILAEARKFAAEGCHELVLTGIHLSSYGRDFRAPAELAEVTEENAPCTFEAKDLGEVIKLLDDVPGIGRVRVGSLEPRIITEEFVSMLASLKHFCPHFHLSLQSGCDTVLKRMNRHYTAEDFLEGCRIIRKYFPDAAITTDIIAGFPGETEEEFETTLRFAETVRFYEMHVFPYSVREGTRAASMPGQLTRNEKSARADRLIALGKPMARAFREARIGREEEILTEEVIEVNGKAYMVGNTREYVRIALDAGTCAKLKILPNCLVRGRVTGFLTDEVLFMDGSGAVSFSVS